MSKISMIRVFLKNESKVVNKLRLRKDLSAPGLFQTARGMFESI